MDKENNITLNVSDDIIKPIVEGKIKAAVLAVLGGSDALIEKIMENVINQKVDANGRPSNSSYEKTTFLEFMFTKQVREAIEGVVKAQIQEASEPIKAALVAKLQSKRGANMVADALLAGLEGTFKNSWTSKIDISINPPKTD